MIITDAQVDIQLTTAALVAPLQLSERAGNALDLVLSNLVAEKVRLDRLALEGSLRTCQLRLHSSENGRGVPILGHEKRRKKREKNTSPNQFSQMQLKPPGSEHRMAGCIPRQLHLAGNPAHPPGSRLHIYNFVPPSPPCARQQVQLAGYSNRLMKNVLAASEIGRAHV